MQERPTEKELKGGRWDQAGPIVAFSARVSAKEVTQGNQLQAGPRTQFLHFLSLFRVFLEWREAGWGRLGEERQRRLS